MDLGLFCDSCHQSFDTHEKIPMILTCGHTVCRECALITQRDSYCKLCNKTEVIENFSALKINQKLLQVLSLNVNLTKSRVPALGGSLSDGGQSEPLSGNHNRGQSSHSNQSGQSQQRSATRALYSFQAAHSTNSIQFPQQNSSNSKKIELNNNLKLQSPGGAVSSTHYNSTDKRISGVSEATTVKLETSEGKNQFKNLQLPLNTNEEASKSSVVDSFRADLERQNQDSNVQGQGNGNQESLEEEKQEFENLVISSEDVAQDFDFRDGDLDQFQIGGTAPASVHMHEPPSLDSENIAQNSQRDPRVPIKMAKEFSSRAEIGSPYHMSQQLKQQHATPHKSNFQPRIQTMNQRSSEPTSSEKNNGKEQNHSHQMHDQQRNSQNVDSEQLTSNNFVKNIQLQKQNTQTSSNKQSTKQFCKIHFDRVIEYFCSQCNHSVCSKCMFLHHNGHDLQQLEDALKILQSKLSDVDKSLLGCQQENAQVKDILENTKSEVESLRNKQSEIIEKKFQELQRRLDERKNALQSQILHKYDSQIFKINDKIQMSEEYLRDINQAQSYYKETFDLLKSDSFIKNEGSREQVQLLERVPEFDKFINEINLKLQAIQLAQRNSKSEFQDGVSIGLRPVELTLNNAISLIQSINFDNNSSHDFTTLAQGLPPKDLMHRQLSNVKPPGSLNNSNSSQGFKMSNQIESSFVYPKPNQISNLNQVSRTQTPTNNSQQQQQVYNFQGIQIPNLVNQNVIGGSNQIIPSVHHSSNTLSQPVQNFQHRSRSLQNNQQSSQESVTLNPGSDKKSIIPIGGYNLAGSSPSKHQISNNGNIIFPNSISQQFNHQQFQLINQGLSTNPQLQSYNGMPHIHNNQQQNPPPLLQLSNSSQPFSSSPSPINQAPSQGHNDFNYNGGMGTNSQSKFAKLKFMRQSTQELTLQLETPHQQLHSGQLIQILPNQDSSSQEQSSLNNQQLQQKQSASQSQANKAAKSPVRIPKTEEQKQAEAEQNSHKIKLTDSGIYCIGDTRYILMYDYKNSQWQQIYFDKESAYQGDLKFTSVCQINQKKREFLMTGGCHKQTLEATSQCFKFTISGMRNFKEIQPMKGARYGHASVFINQMVLVFGGFNHRDDEAQAPHTLRLCEKYSLKENEWSAISPMHQERAYFSATRVKEEFVYVFGGFLNYETTNSIEFYNVMLDKWTIITITMPIKLAKYGLAKVEENQIVIAGGLIVDNSSTRSSSDHGSHSGASFSQMNTVYKFDCNTLKWTKLAKLNFRRTLYSNMPVKENMQIFAIGGTVEGSNEVYDMRKRKWNSCQSYTSLMGQNDLQTYAICSLNKLNPNNHDE